MTKKIFLKNKKYDWTGYFYIACFVLLFCFTPILKALADSEHHTITSPLDDCFLDSSQTYIPNGDSTNLDIYRTSVVVDSPIFNFVVEKDFCLKNTSLGTNSEITGMSLYLTQRQIFDSNAGTSTIFEIFSQWNEESATFAGYNGSSAGWLNSAGSLVTFPNSWDTNKILSKHHHKTAFYLNESSPLTEYWPIDIDNLKFDIATSNKNSTSTVSLALVPTQGTTNQRYYPKEHTDNHPARLSVECSNTTPPPPPSTVATTTRQFYIFGGYVIPGSINCYRELATCDMVIGFDLSVYSRSLASTSPTLWSYPAFTWLWPNSIGSVIASGTIRQFIDWGLANGSTLVFQFPKPTSTTDYVLSIYDPLGGDGTTRDYVVRANMVGTSTNAGPYSTCLGSCDSTFFGAIFCAFKSSICWGLSPSQESYLFLSQSAGRLADKFPFSLSFDLLDALKTGLLTTDDRTGIFRIPMRQATSTGSELVWIEVANASTTEKAIGKDNYILIRKSIVWLAWLSVGIFIIKLLFFKKK